MTKKNNYNKQIVLLIVLAIVIGLIVFFESLKAEPPGVTGEDISKKITDSDVEVLTVEQKQELFPLAPELRGISGYLNTEGITLEELRGKVVLIDFWTYTCINCIRTLPHLVDWHEKYSDSGLVIVGVHTPEFEFEKDYDNVQTAIEKYGILYPVVQDNDFATWRAYGNRYWPRKYLVDGDGFVRYDHIGEGAYDETEEQIKLLLEELGEDTSDIEESTVTDSTPKVRRTPELYAGYKFNLPRGQNIGNEGGLTRDSTKEYTLPQNIFTDVIYLTGTWKSNPDDLESISEGEVVLNFIANSVNIVAESESSMEVNVLIDGEYLTASNAGKDIMFDGERSYMLVEFSDLYNVYEGEYNRQTITFETQEGFKFNAFTFG